MGRVGVGGDVQEGGDNVYLWRIYIVVWQKPTQYCKAIILQLKISLKERERSWRDFLSGPLAKTLHCQCQD